MRAAGTVFFAAAYLFAASAGAEGNDIVTRLTKENIAAFLEETRTASMGERNDMLPGDIETYLRRHLSPDGTFHSKTTFRLPGYPDQETEMKIGTDEFIENVLGGKNLIADYRTALEIKDIKITGNGKSASVATVSTDSGMMPWPDDDGTEKMIPIAGISECAQKIGLSRDNRIEMESADCVTAIRFLPFDKPLGE